MPKPNDVALPRAPQPTRILFDPYNSSSTGHQRAENRLSGSTSWRESRSYKLAHQFRDASGRGGEKHLSDLVGAGSEGAGIDGREENGDWEEGASGLRERGWQDIRALMDGGRKRKKGRGDDGGGTRVGGEGEDMKKLDENGLVGEGAEIEDRRQRAVAGLKMQESVRVRDCAGDTVVTTASFESSSGSETLPFSSAQPPPKRRRPHETSGSGNVSQRDKSDSVEEEFDDNFLDPAPSPPPQIFRNLTLYLNGSTAPLVSDHRLKQLFSQHGGNTSIMLGRRTTTHVVIGEDCGGGLAATKIQKEISTVGGKGIKFVTAHWVLDSVNKGVRLSEARYAPKKLVGRVGGAGQGSVRAFFGAG